MKTFELVVSSPESYELRSPDEPEERIFPTLLSALTHAQLSMSEEKAEMVVHRGGGELERLPLYRMTE
jgi:hypothetical protein